MTIQAVSKASPNLVRPHRQLATQSRHGPCLQQIERAGRTSHMMLDMRVDHRRLETSMSQQQLDRSDIRAGRQEVRGERMAEGVDRGLFVDSDLEQGHLELLLQRSL